MPPIKRRRHLRQRVRTMLHLDFAGLHGALVLDLSEGGAAVLSAVPLTSQKHVTCRLELAPRPIEAEGMITCADAAGRAGIEFTSMSDEDRFHLKEWLFVNAL